MTLLIITVAFCIIFNFINGFHDSANAIATIVSTKVLSPLQAVVWAAFFNFVAYFIFQDHGVANTVAKTVKDGVDSAGEPFITVPVVLAGILAAISWNLFTWWFGIPSSSSHALIGGFAGAAIAHAGIGAINSEPVLLIASFILLAPFIGMLMSFIIALFFLNAFRKTIVPKIVAITVIIGTTIFLSYILKTDAATLKHRFQSMILNIIFDDQNFKWLLFCFVIYVVCFFSLFLSSLNYAQSERWFKRMQLVSSAAFSIGHGGNDAQQVMGVVLVALIAYDPNRFHFGQMEDWIPLTCYTAISLGTMSGGWKIIKTMGSKITKVTPFEGVAAETAGALTLYITEFLKIPVSTTHTITGSIIGVGATKRLSAVRWGVTVNLLWAWILTIPISGAVAVGVYWLFRLFGLG